MSARRGDGRAWLAWAGVASLLAMSTRNPVTLLLLLLVVLTVAGRLLPPARLALLQRTLAWLALWLGAVSTLFNLLLARAGDWPLLSLPADWPLLGGPLTLNAFIYGLLTALALLNLLAIWAVFNAVISPAELLHWLPRRLHLVGVSVSIALTILPGLGRDLGELREVQALRGLQPTGWLGHLRGLPPLLVPLLSLGLERGLVLAESLEARGFSAHAQRSRYRRRRWQWGDSLVTAGALLALGSLLLVRLLAAESLTYTVYPSLLPPPLASGALAASLWLLLPALAAEVGWR